MKGYSGPSEGVGPRAALSRGVAVFITHTLCRTCGDAVERCCLEFTTQWRSFGLWVEEVGRLIQSTDFRTGVIHGPSPKARRRGTNGCAALYSRW